MRTALDKIIRMNLIVDTNSLNPMRTMPKEISGSLYKFQFDFEDSIIIISGKVGKGPALDPVTKRSTQHINWSEIIKHTDGFGSRGYEIMIIFRDGISHSAVFYNR